MKYLSNFLECFATLVPYAVCCYIPFWDKITLKKWQLLIVLSVMFLSETAIFSFDYSSHIIEMTIFVLACVIDYIVLAVTVKVEKEHLLIVFLLMMQAAAIFRGLRFFISARYFGALEPVANLEPGLNIPMSAIETVAVMLVTVPFGILIRKKVVPLMNSLELRRWRLLFLIPLMFLTMIFLQTYITDSVGSYYYLAMLVCTSLGSLGVYFAVFLALKGASESAMLRESNMMLRFKEQYYSMMSAHMDEMRRTRHDMRQHLHLMGQYIGCGDLEKAAQYLADCGEQLEAADDFHYCENFTVGTLLNYYAAISKRKGITLSARADVSNDTFVSSADICVVLGNAMENAVEAASGSEEGKRWIKLDIMSDDGKMAIAEDNSCGETVRDENGDFISTKRTGSGIGISSIKDVARKYGGSAWFDEKGGVFKASIVLYRQ